MVSMATKQCKQRQQSQRTEITTISSQLNYICCRSNWVSKKIKREEQWISFQS